MSKIGKIVNVGRSVSSFGSTVSSLSGLSGTMKDMSKAGVEIPKMDEAAPYVDKVSKVAGKIEKYTAPAMEKGAEIKSAALNKAYEHLGLTTEKRDALKKTAKSSALKLSNKIIGKVTNNKYTTESLAASVFSKIREADTSGDMTRLIDMMEQQGMIPKELKGIVGKK